MTLKEVAKIARVAQGTARKALKNDPTVRSYLRDRVRKVAKDMDYHPNLMARCLRESKSTLVSVVIQDMRNPYYGELAMCIIDSLHQHGFEAVITTSPKKVLEHSYSYQSCGCISTAGLSDTEARILLKKEKLVAVDLNKNRLLKDVPGLDIDFSSCYSKLTSMVLGLQRSKIAFCYEHTEGSLYNKFHPVESLLKEHNIKAVKPFKDGFSSPKEFQNFIKSKPHSIDVLFCENDIIAAKCIAICNMQEIKIPKDIIIIGCDGTLPLENVWTIKVDLQKIADESVKLLKKLQEGKPIKKHIIIEPEIVL